MDDRAHGRFGHQRHVHGRALGRRRVSSIRDEVVYVGHDLAHDDDVGAHGELRRLAAGDSASFTSSSVIETAGSKTLSCTG